MRTITAVALAASAVCVLFSGSIHPAHSQSPGDGSSHEQTLVPRGSEQPSFDCAKAKTAAARLICGSRSRLPRFCRAIQFVGTPPRKPIRSMHRYGAVDCTILGVDVRRVGRVCHEVPGRVFCQMDQHNRHLNDPVRGYRLTTGVVDCSVRLKQ